MARNPSLHEGRSVKPLSDVQREAWRRRELPPVAKLGDGIWVVPVPCEPLPVRFTYSYLIEDDGELVVVDPGLHTDDGWAALVSGLAHADHAPADVTGVIVSHFHPDHMGMASTLAQESDAWVAAHEREIELIQTRRAATSESLGELDSRWLAASGVSDDERDRLSLRAMSAPYFRANDLPNRALADGEEVHVGRRTLRVIRTPGHTPGHICLVDEQAKVVLTGDHILPGISPNVGLHSLGDTSDPLTDYLIALAELAMYDHLDVLPAHEFAFRGIAQRASELVQHHLQRAEEIVATIAEGEFTPWQIAERLSWSRQWSSFTPINTRLALAETLAHLRRMDRLQQVSIHGDDTWRVRLAPDGRSSR